MARSTPPALPSLPLLGNLLDYRRERLELFWRGYKTFGPIFSIRLGPKPVAVILGPESHRFFFTKVDNILSMPEVYKFMIPMFGKIMNAAEPEVHKKQLAILQPAFHGKQMGSHVDVMVREVSDWLDTLGDEGEFELWASFERVSMYIAASALMGADFRHRMASEFWPLYHDLAGGMEFVLPPNLPLPRFRRRDRARKRLHAMIRPMIAERRALPNGHNDFMQTLAEARYPDGSQVPEDTIVGMVLQMVFGAYETTAAQTCWALIQLLQHPDYLTLVMEEQGLVLGNRADNISVDTFRQLERLECALKETERMRPVFSMYSRYTAKPYELGGYQVPVGWLTMICPAVSHRLPEVFPNPNVYDPERFSPERAEDRKIPYSLIGFGGGFYKCPAVHFAKYEMKVVLSLALQRYTLSLVESDPPPDYEVGVIRPKPPCLVRYRRRI